MRERLVPEPLHVREDGSRVIVSPSDPHGFRDALIAAARQNGAEIAFAT